MKIKNQNRIPSKYVLLILIVVCGILMGAEQLTGGKGPLSFVANYTIIPMQKGIGYIGRWTGDMKDNFKTLDDLKKENEELQSKLDDMTIDNTRLRQEQYELERLQELYKLDQNYAEYEKTAAHVIGKDAGNWFGTFTIDKGSRDGIETDMNVIAGNGLVGIVYDVSAHTAKVRTIINDTSMVSAMFLKTNDSCIVNGSLDTMEDGYLEVVYISKDAKVKNGDELVTSYVSSKFNEGITIGKVSDIKLDSTKLTKTAKVTPIVDFKHLKEVLVITDLKKTENLDTGTKE